MQPSGLKYNFRLRTRHGLTVDNISIHGKSEEDAERKLRQMYMHCEVLACVSSPAVHTRLSAGQAAQRVTFEEVVSLISK